MAGGPVTRNCSRLPVSGNGPWELEGLQVLPLDLGRDRPAKRRTCPTAAGTAARISVWAV